MVRNDSGRFFIPYKPCLLPCVAKLVLRVLFVCAKVVLRRAKSTPDPDAFQKYRDTPPISIAILLQKYALRLAESSTYTVNLYHDTAPFLSRCFRRSISWGRWNTPKAGELGAADPSKSIQGAMNQMRGHHLRLLDEAGSQVTSSTRHKRTRTVSTS